MNKNEKFPLINRRDFIKLSAVAAVGGQSLLTAAASEAKSAAKTDTVIHRHEKPPMTYRKLGRTNFMSSRLVFGGGAALAGGRGVRLLDRAFEAGINHFDVGSNVAYRGAERRLAPFLKAHRDEIWVASKAPAVLRTKQEGAITARQVRRVIKYWIKWMDESLKDLGIEYVDAYYLMGVDNPALISSEEIYNAFLKAKAAGKVGHFGVSTHKNAQKVLEAAIETGWYDVAMIGITPAGWYDWDEKDIVEGSPTLVELQPLLQQAREAGIGLVGMKTVRHLAPMYALGSDEPEAFNHLYDKTFLASPLSPFQRAYAYVLEHGLDVVNADMQNFKHLEENIIAAQTSHKYFKK